MIRILCGDQGRKQAQKSGEGVITLKEAEKTLRDFMLKSKNQGNGPPVTLHTPKAYGPGEPSLFFFSGVCHTYF